MDSPGEILSLCRLCLVKDQVNIPIFDEQGDIRQIFLKISSCLPVTITRHDQLPKRICDACSNKLDLLYEFWNSSASAEKTLLSWLGQAGVKDAGEKISAVAQQIAKPAETLVKEESESLEDSHMINESQDSFEDQSLDEGTKDEAEAPPPKRARRTAAVKAQINITPESDEDEDDDFDAGEAMTKIEDESDESESELKDDPSYSEVPGTSADDQAGPSGVGKDGVEAPLSNASPARKENFNHLLQPCFVQLVDILKYPVTVNVKHEGRKKYSCYICFEKFGTNEDLKLHKIQHNDDDDDTDEDAERFEGNEENADQIPISEASTEHDEVVPVAPDSDTPESNFRCVTCNVSFQNQSDVKAHFHNTNKCKYLCSMCKRFFNMKGGFIVHILKHNLFSRKTGSPLGNSRVSRFKCKQCDDCFEERAELMRHNVSAHSISHKPIEIDSLNVPTQNTNYRADPSNPITGTIPIYDCSICYDVFASEKTLIRHQETHKHIGNKPVTGNSTLPKGDSDSQVVQKDCRVTAHNVKSNFTVAPTPANTKVSQPKKAPLRPLAPDLAKQNRLSPPLHFVKNPTKPAENVIRANCINPPQFVQDSTLTQVSNPVAVSQGLQFMNITNPGLTTTQTGLSQTGQSYILINPSNYALGAVNPTLSGMNQMPHLISHASSTVVTSNSPMTNPSLLINSEVNPVTQATFLNSLNEFSTIEPGKPLYFLVPANQQVPEKQMTAVASTSKPAGSNCAWMPKLAPVSDKRSKSTPKKKLSSQAVFTENVVNNPISQPTMVMPFLTNVGSTIQISDDDPNNTSSHSDIIMPIITSFGTVTDDSVHKKPKTIEPATKYESEFQKFLKDGLNKSKVVCLGPTPKSKAAVSKVETSNFVGPTEIADPLAQAEISQDIPSEVKEPAQTDVFPVSTCPDPLSNEPSTFFNVSKDTTKPKIFVKKLTDLIDTPKKSVDKTLQHDYCSQCNQYFYQWLHFKIHMEQRHHKFSCKFFRCEMFDDALQLSEHMKIFHICEFCKGEYRKVSGHKALCRYHPDLLAERQRASGEQIMTYEVD